MSGASDEDMTRIQTEVVQPSTFFDPEPDLHAVSSVHSGSLASHKGLSLSDRLINLHPRQVNGTSLLAIHDPNSLPIGDTPELEEDMTDVLRLKIMIDSFSQDLNEEKQDIRRTFHSLHVVSEAWEQLHNNLGHIRPTGGGMHAFVAVSGAGIRPENSSEQHNTPVHMTDNLGSEIAEKLPATLNADEHWIGIVDSINFQSADEATDLATKQQRSDLHRRPRGYTVCSDVSDEDGYELDTCPLMPGHYEDEGPLLYSVVCSSLLPQNHILGTISANASASFSSLSISIFDNLTYYRELREARIDNEFEAVLDRILKEWFNVGASLIGIAALNVTVSGFTPDTLFGIEGLARGALAVSIVTAGVGIFLDAWFLLLYTSADAQKFKRLATDIYSSFFFFSITSRIPGFLLFFACCSTALLLFAIAWDSGWVKAVIAICVPVSALYYLQYLVFLAESLARGVWRLCSILVSLIRSTSSMFLTAVRWILTMLE